MRRHNRWTTWILILSLVVSLFGNVETIFGADENVVAIGSVTELIQLAENCTLDTWSEGKTIKLTTNIDVSEIDFEGIPIFSGTFEGNGYTITGLNISTSGSVQGLFRYIKEGAIVKNLTVKGNVVPSGTKKTIGGIAGKNAGTIKGCQFIGSVSGESYIGGIAGINESTGKIIEAISQGMVVGEHYIGGIAGENLGIILESINKMSVNTSATEEKVSLETLEKIELGELNSTENTTTKTDVGGITGFSTGIIQGCKNYGIVGYKHIGYNIGGIVGRQSGYISDCTNYGEVYGRKDVGGIAGQMEPYISLKFSEDKISDLQDELNRLQSLMNKTIADASDYSSEVSSRLNTTKGYIDSALETTNTLINQTGDIYNESVDNINDLSARVSDTLERLVPIMAQTTVINEELSQALVQLAEVISALEVTSTEGKKVLNQLEKTLDSTQDNVEDYIKAMAHLSAAFKQLKAAIGDENEMRLALEELSQAFKTLGTSVKLIGKGFNEISEGMAQLKNWVQTDESWESLVEGFDEVGEALEEMNMAIMQAQVAVEAIISATDLASVEAALISLQQATENGAAAAVHLKNALAKINVEDIRQSDLEAIQQELNEAVADLQIGLENIEKALELLKEAISNEEAEAAKADLQEALKSVSAALEKAQNAGDKMRIALEEIKQSGVAGEASESIVKLQKGMENIKEGLGKLAQAVSAIQDAMNGAAGNIDSTKIESAHNQLEAAMDQLIGAMAQTTSVISELKKVISVTGDTIVATDEAMAKIKEVVQKLQGISIKTTAVLTDINEVVTNLANQPTLTIPNLDSEYMNNANQLTTTLGDISNALGGLDRSVSSYNDLILSDIQSISNQFFVVTNLLIEMTLTNEENPLDLSDYKADISDADTEGNIQGKVTKSTNVGQVQGDVNVGGIAGAMAIEYDFDPEDDVTKVGSSSLKFQYLARSVIRQCTNKGAVTSKKNYVGGIVGRMDLGTVINSMGYGNITSNDGEYVGGIAGGTYSHIRNSFAMAVLSGKKHVGGIAGYASKLTNNYAMVAITNAVETKGAIAGEVESLDAQNQNYFVDRKVAGIDGISYTGKAEPISYEAFTKVQGLPTAFTTLQVTFVVDGETVAQIPFQFGGSIDTSKLPEVPEKEGYYGTWPEFEYNALTFSETLEAIYTPYTSVIASSTARDGKPLALVEGTFAPDTVLNVMPSETALPKEVKGKGEVWKVVLTGKTYNKEKSYSLRLLKAVSGKTNIYGLQQDGTWKKLTAKNNGSYICVDMAGNTQTFCIENVSYTKEIIFGVSMTVIALAIAVGSILFLRRRKSNK